MNKEQQILLKISNSIISTLDYEKVLQIISDGMAELLEIETSAIYLLEENNELYLGATTPSLDPNMPDALRKASINDHPHIYKAVINKKSIVIKDTQKEILSPAEKVVVDLRKLRSLIYFPFIQNKNVLGVLILGTSNKARIFSKEEIDLGQTIANQLSIGIQNSRLHHDLKLKNENLIQEIQERKKIENELRKSEAHLSNALRIAKLGHWEYDIAKDLFTFTDEFYEIYRTSAEKEGGYKMDSKGYAAKFVHPDDQFYVQKEIQKAIEAKEDNYSSEVEHRITYSDGETGHIVVRYIVLKDEKGKSTKALGVNQDITKRKQSEIELIFAKQQLEKSEYLYRSLFDQAAEGIFLMTLEGMLVQVNEAFAQMHGYSVSEINNIDISNLDVLKEKAISQREEIMNEVLKGKPVQLEVEHFHKSGHIFPLSVTSQILEINNQKYLLCFHQDLTEKKRIEKELKEHRDNLEKLVYEKTKELDKAIEELKSTNEELSEKNIIINDSNNELKTTLENLKEAQAKLIQSEKMASLGVLTAGVAHEINNPLNYIKGSYLALKSYFLKDKCDDQDYVDNLLDKLKTGLEKSTSIVAGLNQFSRDNISNDEDCDINSILENCLTMLNNQIKHHIELHTEYSNTSLIIKGNIGQLHQAFTNILINSIQSIEDQGKLTIKSLKSGNNIIVEISDTGIGISKENLPKITDPFFTTKDPGKGTGLGLSITYSIIKDHNGKIEFNSKQNKGTNVKVTLPVN